MNNQVPALTDLGIKINKDLTGGVLALYKVNKSGKKGRGLFAARDIFKDEKIISITGPTISEEICNTIYWSYGIDICIQTEVDQYILPNNESRFINHSCNPNLGFSGTIFVAMRNIRKGDELTFDYSMNEISDWKMDCTCGSKNCRKRVTGSDLFNPKYGFTQKYKGYFAPFIEKVLDKKIPLQPNSSIVVS